jgi:hypothetical protein
VEKMSEKEISKLKKIKSDRELMLECVRLILGKNKIDHLNDILSESRKLYNFVVEERK